MQEGGDPYDARRPLRSECRTLFTCVMFLTRLPVGTWADHHPTFLMRSMAYFPLVGLVIGAWGAVWFQAAAALWGAPTAAALSTLATVWLTGAAPPACMCVWGVTRTCPMWPRHNAAHTKEPSSQHA